MNSSRKRIVIIGAAGRDFHAFNTQYRNNLSFEVIAFTATQIPGIENKFYPPELSGDLYPNGISIRPEDELLDTIREEQKVIIADVYALLPAIAGKAGTHITA